VQYRQGSALRQLFYTQEIARFDTAAGVRLPEDAVDMVVNTGESAELTAEDCPARTLQPGIATSLPGFASRGSERVIALCGGPFR